VVNRSVVEWDYASNKDEAPEHRLLYMLFYQMSRMCREKGAVKHDDRLDSLAQGVKYFTDALSISADLQIKQRQQEEWYALMEDILDRPHASANHMVLGMNKKQRDEANAIADSNSTYTWV